MQDLPTWMKVLEWAITIFLILSLISSTAFFPNLALTSMLVYSGSVSFLAWNQNRRKAYALFGLTAIIAIVFVRSILLLVSP